MGAKEIKPGEIPFKQWRMEEAERRKASVAAVNNWFYKGLYPHLMRRKINSRVIFVRAGR